MRSRFLMWAFAAGLLVMSISLVSTRSAAQGFQNPQIAEMIKTAEAKPTPRAADGHPDLNGYWNLPSINVPHTDKDGNIYIGQAPSQTPPTAAPRAAQPAPQPPVDPNPPPYKSELLAKVKMFYDDEVKYDPAFHCKPMGVPRVGPPAQIVQTPKLTVFLYQVDIGAGDATGVGVRLIPTDGRPHRTDVDPMYFGDSIGHWEVDTLVVDVTHLTDDTWLGIQGYFHSMALHVVERYNRKGDTLTYQATVQDPDVLTRPWAMTPQTEILENDMVYEQPPCEEREEAHITSKEHHQAERPRF